MRTVLPSGVRRIASRVSWTVVDQVLSALSNVLLAILVARAVDADGFGAFSTAFLVFSIVIGITRAAVGQPLQITFSSAPAEQFRSAVQFALGASLLIGCATGIIAVGSGFALGGETGAAFIVLAGCLPGLLMQDTCRMAFFSSGRPQRAAAIDALWAVLLFGGLAAVLARGSASIVVPIAIWGVTATLAAAAGAWMLGIGPRLRGAAGWTLRQRRLTGYLLAEFGLSQGLAQVGIILVAVFGSESGVGALRAAQVLLGPLNILGTAAFMFAVPEIARRPSMSQRNRARICAAVAGAMALVTSIYCGILLLVPDAVGEQLLGETWYGAESVLLPMCVMSLSAAIATGPVATLYGMGLANITFRVSILKAPLLVVLMTVGIWTSGAVGAAWAIALTETIVLPLWFWRVRTALRSPTAPTNPDNFDVATVVATGAAEAVSPSSRSSSVLQQPSDERRPS